MGHGLGIGTASKMASIFEYVSSQGEPIDRQFAERSVAEKTAAGDFMVWECDCTVVSMAAVVRRTPSACSIALVYTPPELRGRGYATRLVAELSEQQLAAGRRFCFLHTDLANPTSNAIYERIGYRRVAEAAEVVFG